MEHRDAGQRSRRRGRRSLPHHAYLLTTVCFERRRLFADPMAARVAVSVLADPRLWRGSDLLAWVLMPDHWHGFLQLDACGCLATIMQRAKANSSRELAVRCEIAAPIWQAGFHDRALRSEDDLQRAARYVVANPVRAGLVATPGDYPYAHSRWGTADIFQNGVRAGRQRGEFSSNWPGCRVRSGICVSRSAAQPSSPGSHGRDFRRSYRQGCAR
jgi:putative transposase